MAVTTRQKISGNLPQNNSGSTTDSIARRPHFEAMEYYPDGHPRHSHRTPGEIAEDEKLAAFRGEFCGVLQPAVDQTPLVNPCLVPRQRALVRMLDRPQIRRRP